MPTLTQAMIVAAIALAVRSGLAADDMPSFDVAFSAPAGCPARESFVEQVLARTSRARASTDTPDYRFTLTITRTKNGPRGALGIHGNHGVDNTRDVPGQDCESVVEAAALIAALVLDPHAATGPLHSSVGALPAEPAEQSREQSELRRSQAAVPVPPADAEAERSVAPTKAEPAALRLGIGAAATLTGAIAPRVTPGVALGVRLLDDASSVVAPMLGLDGEFARTTLVRSELGSATFTWVAGRLWGCPLRWQAGSVALRPCAFFDAGFVRATGEETFRGRTQTVPWFAPGALGRFDWMASRAVGFDLQAGVLFPLFRDRYVFLPDDDVHEVPVAAVSASAGATLWVN